MKPCAVALSDEILLIAASLPDAADPIGAELVAAGRVVPIESSRFIRLDDELVVGTLPMRARQGLLSLRTSSGTRELGEIGDALATIQELARLRLAALEPARRAQLCAFLARAQVERAGQRDGFALSRSLAALCELLRERQPLSSHTGDARQALAVELLIATDERSFYARGWLASREARAARLTAVSPEGSRTELLPLAYRFPRSDIAELFGDSEQAELTRPSGFAVWFELDGPNLLAAGWVFELEDAAGQAVETMPMEFVRDPFAARNRVLYEGVLEPPYEQELLSRHIAPAIERLQETHRAEVKLADIRDYGTAAAAPEISLVVPLFRRTDFMQHQLAQFAHDPELRDVDLIYVLDSPELMRDLDYVAQQLFELYRIPFRIAVLRRNSGFSAANNVGVSIARGRLVVLLNSDVIPDAPGWLGRMASFYDATPALGALGAKLLYEDDTIQHAGMFFAREPRTRLWTNEHFFKGMQRSLPAANLARPVPTITAACLMIDRELFLRLGGLNGSYVQGDYEDSDLCLRLLDQGLESWYLPTAELYHLEGQSYTPELRKVTWRYNAWLHTLLWGERIEALVATGARANGHRADTMSPLLGAGDEVAV